MGRNTMTGARLKVLVCGAMTLSAAALGATASSAQSTDAPNVLCTWLVARDDDPATPQTTPCSLADRGNRPTQSASTDASTDVAAHIRPNGADRPMVRVVELWVAVDDPIGIGDIAAVSVTVAGPGIDAHHPTPNNAAQVTAATSCADAERAVASASTADDATGQISPSAASNGLGTGLLDLCRQRGLALYQLPIQVPARWPCGRYVATVSAAGRQTSATSASLAVNFEVICFSQVELDTTDVSFGDLRPGEVSEIVGDSVFDPSGVPGGAVHPTLRNSGNSAVALSLTFAPMTDGAGHSVQRFGARFGTDAQSIRALTVNGSSVLSSGTTVDLPGSVDATGMGTALCPGSTGQLDLAARPDADLVPGEYRGSVSVTVRPFAGCHAGSGLGES
jgi:hypothetical protein